MLELVFKKKKLEPLKCVSQENGRKIFTFWKFHFGCHVENGKEQEEKGGGGSM